MQLYADEKTFIYHGNQIKLTTLDFIYKFKKTAK